MTLESYVRALIAARDAAQEQHLVHHGSALPNETAVDIASAAVLAFIDAARSDPDSAAGHMALSGGDSLKVALTLASRQPGMRP